MSAGVGFSKGEERANFVSHLVGASLSLVGMIILIIFVTKTGSGIHIVSASIFGASMFLLYLSSTLFHGLRSKKAKRIFFLFDQMAIYLLIAGSYTPIVLIALQGPLGWTMFGIEWGLAFIGILYVALSKVRDDGYVELFKVFFYVIMGWLFLIALGPLATVLSGWGLALLFAGGGFYSLGIIFFRMKKVKYSHLVWHLFVIFGTTCHYIMIFRDILVLPA